MDPRDICCAPQDHTAEHDMVPVHSPGTLFRGWQSWLSQEGAEGPVWCTESSIPSLQPFGASSALPRAPGLRPDLTTGTQACPGATSQARLCYSLGHCPWGRQTQGPLLFLKEEVAGRAVQSLWTEPALSFLPSHSQDGQIPPRPGNCSSASPQGKGEGVRAPLDREAQHGHFRSCTHCGISAHRSSFQSGAHECAAKSTFW